MGYQFNPFTGTFDSVGEKSIHRLIVLGSESATTDVTGVFTVPDGVSRIFVECFGAGGSTSYTTIAFGGNGGGGGGGYANGFLDVFAGQQITYTAAAALRTGISTGAVASQTTFGGHITASSGECVSASSSGGSGGAGGGTSAMLTIKGSSGSKGQPHLILAGTQVFGVAGSGGSAFRGGAGAGGAHGASAGLYIDPLPPQFPGGGAGGTSGVSTATQVSVGANGAIFVWY